MKTNEAPEKLYLISDEDDVVLSLDNTIVLRGDRFDFLNEIAFPIKEGTFEYTRTDVFIEKLDSILNKKDDRDSYTIGYIKKHLKEIIKEADL